MTARVNAEGLAASHVGASDVALAAENAPGLVAATARDAARVQRDVVDFASRVDDANAQPEPGPTAPIALAGRRVVNEERALDHRVGVVLDRALASDETAAHDRQIAIVLAAAVIVALGATLVAAIAKTLEGARDLERLAAERDRERAVAAVQRELLAAERLFRVTLEHAPIGILILDETLRVVSANAEIAELFPDLDATIAAERQLFEQALATNADRHVAGRYPRAGGDAVYVEIALRGVVFGDRPERYVIATFRDVTDRTLLAEQVAHEASHDALTALPNRATFEQALRRAAGTRSVALLYLDLDGFKLVNDTHGHHAGDRLLTATAERLRAALRERDVVGRIGGDEFAVLLDDADGRVTSAVAERIVAELREPIAYEGRSLRVSASVGILCGGDVTGDAEQAFRDVDTAMYRAKALGGDRYVTFDPAMREASRRRVELTNDLRQAIAREELAVAYQPIFDLRSRRLLGYEALARWEHPEKGTIAPGEFVPLAEGAGLIESLGRRVLLAACRQLALWRAADPSASTLTMNVNVAAQQILSGSIVDDLRDALLATGLPARCVTLEITESVLLDNVAQADATLASLRATGARIVIDDFGTGYSSLSYLQRFPIDGIKVDTSFVSDGGDALASRPIVEMLATRARVLDLSLTVEGIETEAQLGELLSLGCERGQGYLLSRPVAAELAAPDRHRMRLDPVDGPTAIPLAIRG